MVKSKIKRNQKPVPLPRFHGYWQALILFGLGFFLYSNTFKHDYVLDDSGAITLNGFVQQGFKGIPDLLKVEFWHFNNISLGYYRPLSLITFAIEHQYFGNDPHASHINNGIIYGLTGSFLFLMLSRTFANLHWMFAFFITALFVVHPVHTEVVANLKSRDELLSFLNLVLILFFALKYVDTQKRSHLFFALLFFYFALLSKETAVTGLALLPLFLYFFRFDNLKKSMMKTLPFVVIAFLFFIQKYQMIGTLSGNPPTDIINYPYAITHTKLPSTFLIFYKCVRVVVVPYPLIYDYSYNQIPPGSFSDFYTIAGLALMIGLIVLSALLIKKNKIISFSLIFFFITLMPAMLFVFSRGGIFAERFLYAPCLAFCVLLSYFIFHLFRVDLPVTAPSIIKNRKALNIKPVILVGAITILFALMTRTRNPAWANNISLFSTDIKNAKNSAQNHRHYGSQLIDQSFATKDASFKQIYFKEGVTELKTALAIHPGFGEAYFKLGYAYQSCIPNNDSAIYYYKKAIKASPGYVISYSNLGILYQWMGKMEMASYYYNKAIQVNPNYPDAYALRDTIKKYYHLDVKILPDSVMKKIMD